MRYAGGTVIDQLGRDITFYNLNLRRGRDIEDHIARKENSFSELAVMNGVVIESLCVLVLLSPLSNFLGYAAVPASITVVEMIEEIWATG